MQAIYLESQRYIYKDLTFDISRRDSFGPTPWFYYNNNNNNNYNNDNDNSNDDKIDHNSSNNSNNISN